MLILVPRLIANAALLCCLGMQSSLSRAADWPQFGRDGTRNAVSPERRPPTSWDVGKWTDTNPRQPIEGSSRNVKWSAALGSITYGDPVVADGLIWVGTNNSGWNAQEKLDASVLACFRESDGKLLYRYVSPRLPKGRIHDWEYSSIRCSPFIDNDRLWFVTNRAEVVCLDIAPLLRDGTEPTILWKVDLIGEFGVFPRGSIMFWGHSCSIAGYRDMIYVITGNGVDETYKQVAKPDAPSLICFDRNTGKVVWQDNSPGQNILLAQWASPTIIEIDGRAQCIAPQGDGWVRSFDALSGKPIWQFDMNRKESRWSLERTTRHEILASPVFADNRIFIATGNHPELGERPGRLVCLDPTRQGDISNELAVDRDGQVLPQRRIQAVDPEQGEKAIPNPNSGLVWEFTQEGNSDKKAFTDLMHGMMANVAVHNGLVIAPELSGLVHCLDARTGRRYWVFDALASVYGSPLIIDDKVYVTDTDGDVMIFGLSADPEAAMRKLNGEFQPLREMSMDNSVYCPPIYANGVLYLTTTNRLWAIAADPAAPDLDLAAGFWPQWRGPNRDNASSEKRLLQEWPAEGPPRLWTATGVGEGIASVSVAEGKIFTFGYLGDHEFAVALDEKTGELCWATRTGSAIPESSLMRWLSQRTPTIDGSRLYLVTANGDLVCLSTAGARELWRKSYTADFGAKRPQWGFCDYPLVDGDRLICAPGGPQAEIVALDKQTGNVIWKTQLAQEERAAYAALIVTEAGGLRQYVTFLADGLIGVAADDGRLLWRYEGVGKHSTAHSHTSLALGNQIFCSNGYGGGMALLDVVRDGKNVAVHQVYQRGQGLDAFQDCTTLVGDHLYTGLRDGLPVCLAWKTGETTWGPQRLEGRGKMAIVYADGCLYLRHSDGRMTLAQASPDQFVQRGTFVIPDHLRTVGATSPVIAGRRLYLRDDNRLHCYDIRAEALREPAAQPRTIGLDVLAAAGKAGTVALSNANRERQPPRGVFVPTPHDIVKEMLDLAGVKKTDVVYDLGSGDGRIVIAAAKGFGCKAVGYEIEAELVALSQAQTKTDKVDNLVTIERADVMTVDLAPADVVTLYLLPQQNEKLASKLRKMKPGSRIVSHQFGISGMKLDKTVIVESKETGEKHTIFLYVVPAP